MFIERRIFSQSFDWKLGELETKLLQIESPHSEESKLWEEKPPSTLG